MPLRAPFIELGAALSFADFVAKFLRCLGPRRGPFCLSSWCGRLARAVTLLQVSFHMTTAHCRGTSRARTAAPLSDAALECAGCTSACEASVESCNRTRCFHDRVSLLLDQLQVSKQTCVKLLHTTWFSGAASCSIDGLTCLFANLHEFKKLPRRESL